MKHSLWDARLHSYHRKCKPVLSQNNVIDKTIHYCTTFFAFRVKWVVVSDFPKNCHFLFSNSDKIFAYIFKILLAYETWNENLAFLIEKLNVNIHVKTNEFLGEEVVKIISLPLNNGFRLFRRGEGKKIAKN